MVSTAHSGLLLQCFLLLTEGSLYNPNSVSLLTALTKIEFDNFITHSHCSFEQFQRAIRSSMPVSCIPRAARACIVSLYRISHVLDLSASSLWSFSQLPPINSELNKDQSELVSTSKQNISLNPDSRQDRSIWFQLPSSTTPARDEVKPQRKLRPTVESLLRNSGAMMTLLNLLIQNHGAIVATYPSLITKSAPIPSNEFGSTESTQLGSPSSLPTTLPAPVPFIQYSQKETSEMNERVRFCGVYFSEVSLICFFFFILIFTV